MPFLPGLFQILFDQTDLLLSGIVPFGRCQLQADLAQSQVAKILQNLASGILRTTMTSFVGDLVEDILSRHGIVVFEWIKAVSFLAFRCVIRCRHVTPTHLMQLTDPFTQECRDSLIIIGCITNEIASGQQEGISLIGDSIRNDTGTIQYLEFLLLVGATRTQVLVGPDPFPFQCSGDAGCVGRLGPFSSEDLVDESTLSDIGISQYAHT
mmetsp:Transcript_843/g.2039  ORF Transcript_843/g.2039 Transcript_843/m.2039 type:complete len:210 (+) Transcript_843:296-925(+)